MQQPKAKKATQALFESLKASGQISSSVGYGDFAVAFESRPEYQQRVYDYFRNEGYEVPDSPQKFVEMYRLKDAGASGDPEQTGQNVRNLVRPTLGPPRITGEPREQIEQVIQEQDRIAEQLSSDRIKEAKQDMQREYIERKQAEEPSLDQSTFRAAQMEMAERGYGQAPDMGTDLDMMGNQAQAGRIVIPDIPVAASDEGNIELVDFSRPDYPVITTDQAGIEQMWDTISREMTGKPYSDLSITQQAAINSLMTQRYIPKEVGDDILQEMGYDRDAGWAQTFGSNFARAYQSTFTDAGASIAADGAVQANRDYVTVPGGAFGVYNPGAGERSDGEIRSDVFAEAERIREDINRRLTINPKYYDSFWATTAPQALGSAGAFATTALATKAPLGAIGSGVITANLGAQSMRTQGYNLAIENGASEQDANKVATIFSLLGYTEALPVMNAMNRFGKVAKELKKASPMGEFAKKVGAGMAEEGIQEATSQFFQQLTLQETLDLVDAMNGDELIDALAGGMLAGGVLGLPGGMVSAMRTNVEQKMERAIGEQRERAQRVLQEMDEQYVGRLKRGRDEMVGRLNQQIDLVRSRLSGMPEDSNAPSVVRDREALADLLDMREDMAASLDETLEHNRRANSVDPSDYIDPASLIGQYKNQAEGLIESIKQANNEAVERLSGQGQAQEAPETQETVEATTQEGATAVEESQAEEVEGNEEAAPQTTPGQVVQDETQQDGPTINEGTGAPEVAGSSGTSKNDPGDNESAGTSVSQQERPRPKQATDEEVNLIQRARDTGEDSQYKGERNKVRRVLRDDGTVDYAIKEGAKSTSIIRENENGELESKNLNTGRVSVLGPQSAITKAYYRDREQAPNDSPQQQPATSVAVEPQASEASSVAPTPAPAAEPASVVAPKPKPKKKKKAKPAEEPAAEKTLEERARIKAPDRRFLEAIPEAIRTRVLTDLVGDTDPATFRELLRSQPAEVRIEYEKQAGQGNDVIARHKGTISEARRKAAKGIEKTRRNLQSKVHADIDSSKVGENASNRYSNLPSQQVLNVRAAVEELVLEDPGASGEEIEEAFQEALEENGAARNFVENVAASLVNLESVTQNAESLGFSNPADFARFIAERMLLSGADPKTKFIEDSKGRVRASALNSASEIIRQEVAEAGDKAFSKIKRSTQDGQLTLPAAPAPADAMSVLRPQEIMNKMRQKTGVRMTFKAIKGAYGYYNKKTKRVFIEYKSDLNAFIHEMAHFMDDKFNVVDGLTPAQMNELMGWAKTSGSYNKNSPVSQTNFEEGFAKWLENYTLNPDEATRISPNIFAMYESKVGSEEKMAIDDFSSAFRAYLDPDTLSTDAMNIAALSSPNADPVAQQRKKRAERKRSRREASGAATRTKVERDDVGRFDRRRIKALGIVFEMSSIIDVLPRMYTDAMVTTLRSHRRMMLELGYSDEDIAVIDGKKVLPAQLLNMAIAQRLGRGSMIEQAIANGIIDPTAKATKGKDPERYRDDKGRTISYSYIYDALFKGDEAKLKEDQDAMVASLVAERVVEITARRIKGEEGLMDELAKVGFSEETMNDPNLSPLDKALRMRNAIEQYNAAAEEKIDMPVVSGAGVHNQTDLDRAISMLTIEEAMKSGNESQKSQYDRIQEGKYRYRAVSDMLLRFMRDTGRISDKDYQYIKDNNRHYAAMNRIHGLTPGIQDQKQRKNYSGGYGLTSVDSPIKKAEGSQQVIKDPMESLFQNIGRIINESTRNEVVSTFMQGFVDMAEKSQVEGLLGDAQGIAMEVTNEIEMADGDVRKYKGSQVNHNDAMGSGKTILRAFVKGQERWFLVDRVIALELDTMYDMQMSNHWAATFMRGVVQVYKEMITLFPGFMFKNFIRDVPTTAMMSNVPGYMGLDGWGGLFEEQLRQDFEASGASQAGHFVRHAAGFEAVQQFLWEQRSSGDGSVDWAVFRPSGGKAGDYLRQNPFTRKYVEKYNWAKNRVYQESEEINRRREYGRAYRHATNTLGLDPYMAARYAAMEARGILDYARGGVMARVLNQYLPFFNARAQGIRKFGDLLAKSSSNRERAMVTALRFGSLVVAPTIAQLAALSLLGDDDEEGNSALKQYANLPDWQRYYFWNVKTGNDSWLSIPKPFDFGAVGTGLESMIMRAVTGEEKYTEGLISEMSKAFSPITMDQVMGAGGPLKLIAELPANYKFFYDTNIVPVNEVGKASEFRTDDERASVVGRGVKHMFKAMGYDIDARKADYAFETLFGSWGKFTTKMADDPMKGLYYTLGIFRNNPGFNAKDYQDYMSLLKEADLRNIQPYKDQAEMISSLMSSYIESDDAAQREAITNVVLDLVSEGAKVYRDKDQRQALVDWRVINRERNKRR